MLVFFSLLMILMQQIVLFAGCIHDIVSSRITHDTVIDYIFSFLPF